MDEPYEKLDENGYQMDADHWVSVGKCTSLRIWELDDGSQKWEVWDSCAGEYMSDLGDWELNQLTKAILQRIEGA